MAYYEARARNTAWLTDNESRIKDEIANRSWNKKVVVVVVGQRESRSVSFYSFRFISFRFISFCFVSF